MPDIASQALARRSQYGAPVRLDGFVSQVSQGQGASAAHVHQYRKPFRYAAAQRTPVKVGIGLIRALAGADGQVCQTAFQPNTQKTCLGSDESGSQIGQPRRIIVRIFVDHDLLDDRQYQAGRQGLTGLDHSLKGGGHRCEVIAVFEPVRQRLQNHIGVGCRAPSVGSQPLQLVL
ncbi:hypothetical protein AB0D65_15645 [Streptomyces griseoloalbus]|uniref:Uncharacterized protein n=1 Tax=Streptomyces griseoloalbus TaxID=67303 RepID=A0ABV3E797_9ACTN